MTEELNLLRYSHSEQVKIKRKIFISLPKVVKFPLTLISCHVIVNLTTMETVTASTLLSFHGMRRGSDCL